MKSRVLILCTGNSARSQMAEGLLRHDYGCIFEVESAGTKPSFVRPEAIAVMSELGIHISGHRSKHLDEFASRKFDYVLTVCDNVNQARPVCPGNAIRIHKNFEDPAASTLPEAERMTKFRDVRDQLRAYLRQFVIEQYQVRPCTNSDWPHIGMLLGNCNLPLAGASDYLHSFLVATFTDEIVGVTGLEIHGKAALLRSVAVDTCHRGHGVADLLVQQALQSASRARIQSISLLTTSAPDYFRRFGFVKTKRSALPAELSASEELRGACPASAIAMTLFL